MPDLRRYRDKRDPRTTPEPLGDDARHPPRPLPAAAARAFVVQQHAARSLHWDLRLEIDGVLASWAVPRGPSLDPSERRLAVQTEDHPIEYASFEGVIPEGNYGAGAMIVWDRGSYHTADALSPAESLARGKLDLVLDGHKLRGRFALVKTRGGDRGGEGRSWLLLHKDRRTRRGEPVADVILQEPRSVLSGLTVEQVRDGVCFVEEIAARADALGARAASVPAKTLRPMLATTAERPFSKPGWLFEVKHDGMRVLAEQRDAGVSLFTRRGRDVAKSYPEIRRALELLPLSHFVLDGEIVALDGRGHASFERLQRRFSQSEPLAVSRAEIEVPTVLYAFDLLAAAGRDLRALPLRERKTLLEHVVPRLGQVRYTDHVEEHGEKLFEAACEHEIEGVIAKRADSRYKTGRRSPSWQKLRVPHAAELAIVGWEEGRGARQRLGALKLAWYQDGRLCYAGNVGSGLDDATIDVLLPSLERAERSQPAFENAPEPAPRGSHFVEPAWAARVSYTEVTSQGLLRHPVLLQVQAAANLSQCVAPVDREEEVARAPEPADPPETELKISRREKVFWPHEGITKGDLLDYYEGVWPWIAPYLRDRPLVLTRYPDGIEGKSFFQQNAPEWTPAWATHETIDGTDFFICNELRTLLHVVNSGAIPLHVWSSRRTSIDHPDWIVIDLDPKAAPFADVVTVARHIHRLLDELAVQSYVKTSGQAGLHVLVPLGGRLGHDDARALAEVLARVVVRDLPEIATIARPIAARGDKVYVDFGQNGRGRLIVAPFSVRPKPGAPVSTPLTWAQVTTRLDPGKWSIHTTPGRMKRSGDPLRPVLDEGANVGALLDALAAMLA
jgi:bifunctional non-homologous end joining protein LigD